MRILIKCKECGNEMDGKLKVCPECGTKKPFYKKGWFGAISFIVVVTICASIIGSGSSQTTQAPTTNESIETYSSESTPEVETNTIEVEDDVPTEYKSALKSSISYSNILYMSKQAIYDQLISEHGGQFSVEAANYAIDNIQADWNRNALETAKKFQERLHMSPNAIYDQLISEHGSKFTVEEAQYAVDNLE